jgi:hypothetical protein
MTTVGIRHDPGNMKYDAWHEGDTPLARMRCGPSLINFSQAANVGPARQTS